MRYGLLAPNIERDAGLSGYDWSDGDVKTNMVQKADEHAENVTMETALASSSWRVNVCLCRKGDLGYNNSMEKVFAHPL